MIPTNVAIMDEIEETTYASRTYRVRKSTVKEEHIVGDVIFPEQTTSGVVFNLQYTIQPDIVYDVYINGVVYTCEAHAYGSSGARLGNGTLGGAGGVHNNEPFCILWAGATATGGMFFKDNTLSYPLTIKVTEHSYVNIIKPSFEYCINGYTDGKEAVQQAIYLILNTERYKFIIYSWNYGVELVDLFGKPMSYVIAELPRRIKEALLQDDRITDVNDFTFEVKRSRLYTTFTVTTIYGDIPTELEVAI
jgi:hypothetical protein